MLCCLFKLGGVVSGKQWLFVLKNQCSPLLAWVCVGIRQAWGVILGGLRMQLLQCLGALCPQACSSGAWHGAWRDYLTSSQGQAWVWVSFSYPGCLQYMPNSQSQSKQIQSNQYGRAEVELSYIGRVYSLCLLAVEVVYAKCRKF